MKRIGLYLFIIGITFIKAYGQEDSGPVWGTERNVY